MAAHTNPRLEGAGGAQDKDSGLAHVHADALRLLPGLPGDERGQQPLPTRGRAGRQGARREGGQGAGEPRPPGSWAGNSLTAPLGTRAEEPAGLCVTSPAAHSVLNLKSALRTSDPPALLFC